MSQENNYAVGVGSDLLGGIDQFACQTVCEVVGAIVDGELYSRAHYFASQKPTMGWTTRHVAAALALCGLAPLDISALTGGLKGYAQLRGQTNLREGALSHRQFTVNDGLIVPQTLSVSQGQDAKLSFAAHAIYDGTNDPVAITESVTLPTGMTSEEAFSMGPVQLGGTSLSGFHTMSLEFGMVIAVELVEGNVWPTEISVSEIRPILSFQGKGSGWIADFPLEGTLGTHANSIVYLRKRDSDARFVADATAQHIKMTANGLIYVEDIFTANGTATGDTALKMACDFDGTNLPVTFDTASTIS